MNIFFVKRIPVMSIFLRISSQILVKFKKDLNLYELRQDFQPSLGEEEDLNSP